MMHIEMLIWAVTDIIVWLSRIAGCGAARYIVHTDLRYKVILGALYVKLMHIGGRNCGSSLEFKWTDVNT